MGYYWNFLFEFAIYVSGQTELLDFFKTYLLRVYFHVQLWVVYNNLVDPSGLLVGEHVILIFVLLGV